MFKSKKSSLVFSIFIIAIILSVMTIILGWITSYSYDSVIDSELNSRILEKCSNLDILTVRVLVDDATNRTYSGPPLDDFSIDVLLENNGRETLKGVVIRAYADNEEVLFSEIIERDLKRHTRSTYSMNLKDQMIGDCRSNEGPSNCYIEEIEIIPMVEVDFDGRDIYECSNYVRSYKRSDDVVVTE